MNIVITGATSFIGRHLTKRLLEKGHYVYVCIRPTSLKKEAFLMAFAQYGKLIVVEVDMENIAEITDVISVKCDVFYHLAWEGTRHPERDNDELQKLNYIYTMDALSISKLLGCSKFVGIGSQAEYGNTENKIKENHCTRPNTAYGIYKLKAFNEGLVYSRSHNIEFIWTRIFSLYGVGDSENSLIMLLVTRMMKNESIDLTECSQIWNYLHVEDAVEAIIGLQEADSPSGCYNIASNDIRTLKDYVLELQQILGSKSNLNFGVIPYGKEGKINLMPSLEKIKKLIEWEPKIPFKKGINELMKDVNKCEKDERYK